MVLKTTPKNQILFLLFAVAIFLIPYKGISQTRVYASSATSFQSDNVPQSYDQNMTTAAQVRASTGILVGVGQYSGYVELQYPGLVPANTTSYVKITTDDNLLPSLLGGSLGGLLANVLGAVLIGNQEFTVEAKNNTTVVLDGDSNVAGDFAGDRLRIVINAAGEYFVAITPASAYNRIRLTNRVGSLLGLNNVKTLNVFEAFYDSAPANCGSPAFTSFSGSGITLDALQLGSAGVQNPQFAIDANTTNFSVLSLGLLGVGSTISQTVYFEGLSGATDQFNVRLRAVGTLLDLNLANNVNIMSYNGGTQVTNQTLSSLLTLNLLNMQGGVITTIPINPGAPVDRIVVSFNSLVGASVAQNLEFYGVTRTVAPPTITPPVGGSYFACSGGTASLIATTAAGNELRWYTTATGGTATTLASGAPYVTAALTATTTFYVAAAKIGCPEESSRVAVPVTVTTVATPTTNNASQQFCSFASPTVASLQVNEPGVTFYDAAVNGNLLASTTPLANNAIYYATLTDAVTGCQSTTRLAITVTLTATCDVTLSLKAMLQGALFNSTGGLMRDNLREGGYIPLNQPYSSALNARFTHVGGGGSEVTTNAVIQANAGTGNAVVDWVFVEIRDASAPQTVVKTAAALIQRDGDIVAANGGPLVLNLPSAFRVSIKHRNHFGALYNQVLTATNQAVALDFTTLTDANLYAAPGFTGQQAMATVGGVRALYAGNTNFDSQVKYDGSANDRQVAASQVLSFPGNASQILNYSNATGYFSGDVNMDGKVLYDGANNDRQLILNIIVTYALNTNTLSNYNGMSEQVQQ
ncbi:immunoglobulin domain-containing protein [Flavobacterium suzhouense]|uniref:Ig-like domain-containing protein n=1 Tax=Flavobacterium suzhouense TaxID=1529638 RepID=A0ABW5NYQ7_9FLAO